MPIFCRFAALLGRRFGFDHNSSDTRLATLRFVIDANFYTISAGGLMADA